jgi:putative copper resistance protein D
MDNFLLLPRVVAAAFSDLAFATVFGAIVACLWLDPEDQVSGERLRIVALLGLSLLLVALTSQMFLQTATMIGIWDFHSIRSQIAVVLTGTHAGRALLLETAVAVLPFLLLLRRSRREARPATWIALAMLVGLTAVRSAIGHSAGDGDFTLPEFVQFIHLLATALWAGSVIVAGIIVLPGMLRRLDIDPIAPFTRKLSRAVTVGLSLIVLSGIYNSYRGLGGSLTPLADTQWGKVLDLKLALIGLALMFGALNRRMLRGNRSLEPRECHRLATIVRVEALIMLLILTVSAWLANSPPANQL